jgi:hypothetical protein
LILNIKMDSNSNCIDFSFLDVEEKKYIYTVMIVLNRPLVKEFYMDLKNKTDYIICADGGANRIYDCLRNEVYFLFNIIIGILASQIV